MPAKRVAMRHVREMQRLTREAGLTVVEAARRTGVSRSTVREMLWPVDEAGLAWPLALDQTDAALEVRLYGPAGAKRGQRRRVEPDWAVLNRELKRKHVTLQILWDEYIEAHSDGYRYSRFCDLYRGWEARLPVTMRQTHLGGDTLFVDYAGDTVPMTRTGKLFLEQALEALATLRRVERSGNKIARGRAGPLRIGYVFSAAMSGILSRSLCLLSQVAPEVEPVLEVMETPAQLDAIASGRIDLGFVRPRPSYPDGVIAVRVHRELMILAMSREHPLASRPSIAPSDLVGLVFIIPQFHEEVGLIDVIRDLSGQFGIGAPTTVHTGDFISAASLAVAGKGVVLAPASLENLRLRDLCFRRIDGYSTALDLVMVVHPSVHGDISHALLDGLEGAKDLKS